MASAASTSTSSFPSSAPRPSSPNWSAATASIRGTAARQRRRTSWPHRDECDRGRPRQEPPRRTGADVIDTGSDLHLNTSELNRPSSCEESDPNCLRNPGPSGDSMTASSLSTHYARRCADLAGAAPATGIKNMEHYFRVSGAVNAAQRNLRCARRRSEARGTRQAVSSSRSAIRNSKRDDQL